jgi:predicted outer membrane protein
MEGPPARHDFLVIEQGRSRMNRKRLAAFAFAVLLGSFLSLVGGRALAQGKQTDDQDSLRTAMVLSFLHQANLREVDMASIVKTRSDSQPVVAFADRLIADHKNFDRQIVDFANQRGLNMDAVAEMTKRTVERTRQERQDRAVGSATGEWAYTAEPGIDPDVAHLAMTNFANSMDKMHKLTGAALTREFIQAVTNDHQLIIDSATSARKRINDPEVANLVDRQLQADRNHLAMAQRLQDRVAKQ